MKSLNKKNGNLRGATINVKLDDADWKEGPVQGWVIGDSKFNIYYMHCEDLEVEVEFSKESLARMFEAINAKDIENA